MLLVTESAVEFEKLRDELLQDIQPQGAIERRYAEDVACLTWEVRRYRAAKAGIINAALVAALCGILNQVLPPMRPLTMAGDLARGWFDDKEAKAEVMTQLQTHGLDESAIAAEALGCAPKISSAAIGWRHSRKPVARSCSASLARSGRNSPHDCGKAVTPCWNRKWQHWRRRPVVQISHGERTSNRSQSPQCTQQHGSPLRFWKEAVQQECVPTRPVQAFVRRRVDAGTRDARP